MHYMTTNIRIHTPGFSVGFAKKHLRNLNGQRLSASSHAASALWLLIFTCFAWNQILCAGEPKRKPIPNLASIAKAEKAVRDVYSKEYKSINSKFILRLIKDAAGTTDDAPTCYVLLTEASRLATEKKALDLAVRALDKINNYFIIKDYIARKAALLDNFSRKIKKGPKAEILADAYLDLVREAVDADNFAIAGKAAKAAEKFARRLKNKERIKAARAIKTWVRKQAKLLKQISKAMDTLKTKPDDPKANLACGRYYCFQKGNWEKGLPLLTKGYDRNIAGLARKELAGATTAKELTSLADGWWEITKKEKLPLESVGNLRSHASELYEKALPKAKGWARTKIEARLKAVGKVFPPAVWISGIRMQFVRIPAGEFMMGCTIKEITAYRSKIKTKMFGDLLTGCIPRHKVRITYDFLMSKYPVTIKDFSKFIADTDYKVETEKGSKPISMINGSFKSNPDINWREPGYPHTSKHPVTCISWNDSKAFCDWLNKTDHRKPKGWKYRLPTEAEWEYAARGPKSLTYPWGNTWKDGCAYVGIAPKTRGNPDFPLTTPVDSFGKKGEGPFGVADMIGNIWEFCEDDYDESFFQNSPKKDPFCKGGSGKHVVKGGGAIVEQSVCFSAYRAGDKPTYTETNEGFRVVLVPESAP